MTENEIAAQVVDAATRFTRRWVLAFWSPCMKPSLRMSWRSEAYTSFASNLFPSSNVQLEIGFRADLIVEGKVIVEIKSIEAIAPVHKKQLLTHLRLTDLRLGLLINFGAPLIKDGITKLVNRLKE